MTSPSLYRKRSALIDVKGAVRNRALGVVPVIG